ncbi:MAG: hypothetical protein ABSB24_05350 [Gaiellaceae bacterium]
MKALLEKWAPWLAGAVLVAGVCAYAVTRATSGGSPAAPASQKTVPLDAKARAVAREFVATAVARKDLARAWTLTAPELKNGLTLAQWLTGQIPVQPYPVAKAAARYTVEESHPDDAVMRVSFLPPPASSTPAGDFLLMLRRLGGRWLVSGWTPQAIVRPSG